MVMEAIHQFQGITDSTMSHGEGWQFIQVGRFIERASATAMLLEAYHDDLWVHPENDSRRKRVSRMDGSSAVCHGIRGLLQGLHRRPHTRPDPRVPSARCAVSAFAPLCHRQHAVRAEAIQRESGKSRADATPPALQDVFRRCSASAASTIFCARTSSLRFTISRRSARTIHSTIYELYVDYSIQTALAG